MSSNGYCAAKSPGMRVLLVSPAPSVVDMVRQTLANVRCQVEVCDRFDKFERLTDADTWPLVLVWEENGCELAEAVLHKLRREIADEQTQAVILSPSPSADDAMLCVQRGASDYRAWPVLPSEILELTARAARRTQHPPAEQAQKTEALPDSVAGKENVRRVMVGASRPMLELSRQLVKVARAYHLSIFVTGEAGTGKEVIARQIHRLSERPGSFCAANCAAIVESLLESN
jgi:DNA-binding NtrC family response regulator